MFQGPDPVRAWLMVMLEQFDGQLEYTASDIEVL